MALHSNIKIAYMNIDGLYKRVDSQRICKTKHDREFQNDLFKHDIITFVETHCNEKDHPILHGYCMFQNIRTRSPNSTRNYGALQYM